jgi:arginase
MTGKPFAIVEAPSVLGLFPKGVETLPDALLASGLAERLGARHAGRVERRGPLVRDEDVVVLGRRDAADAEEHGSRRVEDTAIEVIDLAALRAAGAEGVAASAMERLSRPELDGFWIHLDADLLDDAVMPAVDYRMPDGLSWDELVAILRAGVASGRAVGIEVTIFNPRLDRDGSIARAFADALARGLKP